MAPYIPVPNVLQCEFRGTLNGAQVENVTYWLNTTTTFEDAADIIAATYMDSVWPAIRDSISPQFTLREFYFTDLTTQDGPTFTYSTGLPVGGNGVIGAVPNGVALCLSYRTRGRGRSARGRNYIAGIISSLVVASAFTLIAASAFEAAYNSWRVLVAGQGIDQVVVSRYNNGAARPAGITTQVSEAVVTTLNARSQRRRNLGIGI